jgi:hypothetical protein
MSRRQFVIVIIVLAIADVVTTEVFMNLEEVVTLGFGNGYDLEFNPIMRYFMRQLGHGWIIVKLIGTGVFIAIIYKMKMSKGALMLATFLMTMIVAKNIHAIIFIKNLI